LRYVVLIVALALAVGLCFALGGFTGAAWVWMLPVFFVGSLLGMAALLFALLLVMCAFVDLEKPQEKDNRFYRLVVSIVTRLAVWILRMRVHTEGLENTPKDGRFLLVCNHLSLLDPVILLTYYKNSRLAFISKRENKTMFLVGKLMHKMLCQLINRENDKEALKTIISCIRIIGEDKASVAVFPEGYIHGDNLLHTFRSGVFKIAQKAKVPIVVCTLQNTQKVKVNMPHLKPTDIHLHLVGVLMPEDFEGLTTVDIGNRVHEMMARDLGPDLVLQETP